MGGGGERGRGREGRLGREEVGIKASQPFLKRGTERMYLCCLFDSVFVVAGVYPFDALPPLCLNPPKTTERDWEEGREG